MAKYKVRVFVHQSKIAELNAPGGDVDRFVHRIANRAFILAYAGAPRRSGALQASIDVDRSGSNQYGVNYRVVAGAEHASWVHEGTGPVSADMTLYAGAGRHVPAQWMPWRHARIQHRNGQLPNPFLARALRAAMRESGL